MGIDTDFHNRDSSTDGEISEDSLRLALERLGARSNKKPAVNNYKKPAGDQRRRRFVQEGQVVVEHQHLSRTTQRATAPHSEDQGEEITRLRNMLKLEQRRNEDVQRELGDLQIQCKTLETHLVHEKLNAKELKEKSLHSEQALFAAQEQIRTLTAELAATKRQPEPQMSGLVEKRRGPGRPRRIPQVEASNTEPEPVQWWKD